MATNLGKAKAGYKGPKIVLGLDDDYERYVDEVYTTLSSK